MYFNYYFLLLWGILLIGLPCKVQSRPYPYDLFSPNLNRTPEEKRHKLKELNKKVTEVENIIAENTKLIEETKKLLFINDPPITQFLEKAIQLYEDTKKLQESELKFGVAHKHGFMLDVRQIEVYRKGNNIEEMPLLTRNSKNQMIEELDKNITELQNIIAENTKLIQETKEFLPNYYPVYKKMLENAIQPYEDTIKEEKIKLERYEAQKRDRITEVTKQIWSQDIVPQSDCEAGITDMRRSRLHAHIKKDHRIQELNITIKEKQNIIAENTKLMQETKELLPSHDPKVNKALEDLIKHYEDTIKVEKPLLEWYSQKHYVMTELSKLQNSINENSKGLIPSQDKVTQIHCEELIPDIFDAHISKDQLIQELNKNIKESQNIIAENTKLIEQRKELMPNYYPKYIQILEKTIQPYEDIIKEKKSKLGIYVTQKFDLGLELMTKNDK